MEEEQEEEEEEEKESQFLGQSRVLVFVTHQSLVLPASLRHQAIGVSLNSDLSRIAVP